MTPRWGFDQRPNATSSDHPDLLLVGRMLTIAFAGAAVPLGIIIPCFSPAGLLIAAGLAYLTATPDPEEINQFCDQPQNKKVEDEELLAQQVRKSLAVVTVVLETCRPSATLAYHSSARKAFALSACRPEGEEEAGMNDGCWIVHLAAAI